MPAPSTTPPGRHQGVATPGPDRIDSLRPCVRCGAEIPKPRPGQKACSSRCSWALWKAGRQRVAQVHLERDRQLRDLLREALNVLERGGPP
jgi:predicted nucleic acid-binding Zn ribbon protein